MIKGLDVGYAFTKDNNGKMFKSAFSHYDRSITGSNKITIDGVDYYIGDGAQISDADKTDSETNKVCTIYSILLGGVKDVKLCVGLPVAQYKAQRDKLKETILSYNKCRVEVNNALCKYNIDDVLVSMQGVSSLYTMDKLDGEYIVIDIGGLTIDVSLVEFSDASKLVQCDTWYKGIRTLYSDVMERVNNKFSTKLGNEYGDRILRTGYLRVDGKEESLEFLKPYLQNYIDDIAEEIKLRYPYQTANIVLTGGGAIPMQYAFINRFHQARMIHDPQFSNAKGYYLIGCHKFKERM